MSKLILYIAVSFITFAISMGVYFLFPMLTQPGSGAISTSTDAQKANFEKPEFPEQRAKVNEWLSNEEKAQILFGSTIDVWRNGGVPSEIIMPRLEVVEKVRSGLYAHWVEGELTANAERPHKSGLIDLDKDGESELAILSNCSDGRCQFWVLKKIGENIKVILSSYQEVESFELQNVRTRGFLNIETFLTYPGSKTINQMKVYKFDGEAYRITDCFDREYRFIDDDGILQYLPEPKFHSLHCC
ncbi:hypothetical protein BH20ACI2_BH20ACI2_09250 [soil metagenome]